jgi:chromosomal replication initiator protein
MSPYIIPGIKKWPEKITMKQIIECVCNYFEVTPEMINKRCRVKRLVIARQYSMYFIKHKTDNTLKTIGEQFGSKPYDHASIIHAINTINNFLSIKDQVTINNIESIKRILNEPY